MFKKLLFFACLQWLFEQALRTFWPFCKKRRKKKFFFESFCSKLLRVFDFKIGPTFLFPHCPFVKPSKFTETSKYFSTYFGRKCATYFMLKSFSVFYFLLILSFKLKKVLGDWSRLGYKAITKARHHLYRVIHIWSLQFVQISSGLRFTL